MDTRHIPAPGLREVAEIWWDVDADPYVHWRDGGALFVLTDATGEHELRLLTLGSPAADPAALARILADGLAACDFPPTGDGAAPGRVDATLRAAGRSERVVDGQRSGA